MPGAGFLEGAARGGHDHIVAWAIEHEIRPWNFTTGIHDRQCAHAEGGRGRPGHIEPTDVAGDLMERRPKCCALAAATSRPHESPNCGDPQIFYKGAISIRQLAMSTIVAAGGVRVQGHWHDLLQLAAKKGVLDNFRVEGCA